MRGQIMAGFKGLISMAGYCYHFNKNSSFIKPWKLSVSGAINGDPRKYMPRSFC